MRSAIVILLGCACLDAQTVEFSLLPGADLRSRLEMATQATSDRYSILTRLFNESGCTGDNLTSQPVKHAKTPNIVCTLPGASADTILVTAHYDMTGPGKGVVDNWTGATMLTNLYVALSKVPRQHTIRFVGFTDEEKGLIGSTSFVSQAKKEGLLPIKLVVNIDSLGAGPASVWASRADKRLLFALRQVEQAMSLQLSWVNVDGAGDTDSHPFAEKKLPVIDFHSLTSETFPILHSARDTMDAIRFDDYEKSYRTLAVYLAFLDLQLDAVLARKIKIDK